MPWKVKERQRYALIEQDEKDPRKHRGTFYIGPRHVKHQETKQFVEFHYVQNPLFASEKNCRVFAQNSHVAIEVYDYYTKLFDPDYDTVSVYDERFVVQQEFKAGKWKDVAAWNPHVALIKLEDGVEIKRVYDTDYGEATLEITHIVKAGAFLKHNIVFTNKAVDTTTFRCVMKLAGITDTKVKHEEGELLVSNETSIGKQPFFFVGEDNKHLKLTEYLWSLTENKTLQDIVFDVHAQGCKADIIIGNYTLSHGQQLKIDPDSTTFYSGAGDGRVYYGTNIWNVTHDSSTGYAAYTQSGDVLSSHYSAGTYHIHRFFLPFDTSALDDGATIQSATLNVNVTNVYQAVGTSSVAVVQTSQASTSELVNEDFDQCGAIDNPTEGATRIAITSTGWKQWTLNATGLGWISKTGWTKLGLRIGWLDCDDVAPTDGSQELWITIDTSETANDPYLQVTWELAAGQQLFTLINEMGY